MAHCFRSELLIGLKGHPNVLLLQQLHNQRASPLLAHGRRTSQGRTSGGTCPSSSRVASCRPVTVTMLQGHRIPAMEAGPPSSRKPCAPSASVIAVPMHRGTQIAACPAHVGGAAHRHNASVVHNSGSRGVLPQVGLTLDAEAAKVAIEVLPEHSRYAVESHGVNTRIEKAANWKRRTRAG